MTTFELKRSILQDINALMDDEAAMRRISRYIRRLRNSTSTKTYPEATQELRKIAAFCKQQWGIEDTRREPHKI